MPIGSKDSIQRLVLHVSNGQIGFPTCITTIKPSGIYIEGETKQFMHISMHNRPLQNDPTVAECRLTIPRETRKLIRMHGFSANNFRKWYRKIGTNNSVERAIGLIFPEVNAKEKDALVDFDNNEGEKAITICLRENAAIIEFWYTKMGISKLRKYLEEFSQIVLLEKLPHGENFALTVRHEQNRDYASIHYLPNHESYCIVDNSEESSEKSKDIIWGLSGYHCLEIILP